MANFPNGRKNRELGVGSRGSENGGGRRRVDYKKYVYSMEICLQRQIGYSLSVLINTDEKMDLFKFRYL